MNPPISAAPLHVNTAERRLHNLFGWGLLSPALILLTLFAFFPMLATLWASFFSRWHRTPSERFQWHRQLP